MLFRNLGQRLLAGGFLLCLSVPFGTQRVAAQTSAQVLTPFGYRDRANVHLIFPGYELNRMADQHIRMQNPKTGEHIDFPKPESVNQKRVPFTDNGWITYASWYNNHRRAVSYFSTDWYVPSAPASYAGQTIFQFNSIEPASFDSIIQPVLQYGQSAAGGGNYWCVASWFVTGNQAYFTTPVQVNVGTFLGGQITLNSKSNGLYTYTSDFYGINGTSLTIYNIPQLVWCTETLEVYGVSQCAEFPNMAYSEMFGIYIYLRNGTNPTMNWSVTNAQPYCGTQTTIVNDGSVNGTVYIYF
jgi:hypothetical protein